MFEISAADILKVSLTVITLFIAVVKTPFRIRRENHDKLLKLLESVEKPHSERMQLLLFRDYIGSKTVGLAELQQLLALPDGVTALERYRPTGGRQQILRTTSKGFVLQRRADSALKRSLLSCRYLLKYLLFVTLLVLMPVWRNGACGSLACWLSRRRWCLCPVRASPTAGSCCSPALYLLSSCSV
ncbi:hypothetical protein [Serratia marcescens]|uniref:hypothetical protein n=1 Tax=Serratia marcescens TaxID=615 RepID=UPI001EF917F4|nr:hypothetical protein [Serratia marcescens]